MSARKRYRPRQITFDTLGVALRRAAKPPAADREEILSLLHLAHKALREGVATELQWSIIAGAVDVSLAIERQGVVRGLQEHLKSAEHALQSVYDRAMLAGSWKPTSLHYQELDAVLTFVDLHTFQVNQLGRAELLKAIGIATRQVTNSGANVNVVHDLSTLQAC